MLKYNLFYYWFGLVSLSMAVLYLRLDAWWKMCLRGVCGRLTAKIQHKISDQHKIFAVWVAFRECGDWPNFLEWLWHGHGSRTYDNPYFVFSAVKTDSLTVVSFFELTFLVWLTCHYFCFLGVFLNCCCSLERMSSMKILWKIF